MSCKQCSYVINGNYRLVGVSLCQYCSTEIDCSQSIVIGTYKGKNGTSHTYRVHPVLTCPECESDLFLVEIPCGDDDLPSIVKEYEDFFGINQEHWIGKSA